MEAGCTSRGRRRPSSVRAAALLLLLGLPLAACGGDGTTEPPPPPPSPPPPPGPPPPPPDGAIVSLGVGADTLLVELGDVRSFTLPEASEPRDYLVVVHSAATVPESFDLRVLARGPDAPGVSAAVQPSTAPRQRFSLQGLPPELARRIAHDLTHARLQENMRRELRRVNPRPAFRDATSPGEGGGAPAASFSVGARVPPSVDDTLDVNFAVDSDLMVSCENMKPVTSVVRAVGERFVLAEDTAVTDGFGPGDWADLNVLLDDVTFPVDSTYYGAPADIDGNDRVVILFTAEVNKLTERDSDTFIGGLFWPGDLALQEDCAASNEAEILYLQAADPDGVFSDEVSVESARRNARSVTSHEFQHLLSAEQRVLPARDFGVLEDPWLSEGLAHIAEEVVGLKVVDLKTRQNFGLDEVAPMGAKRDAFNIHHLSNFFRLGHHLTDPHETLAFGRLQGLTLVDPGGLESLKMRGNAWIFLRWLADRFAPATPEGIVGGSAEEILFRELSTGGPGHLIGVDNILRAVDEVSGETPAWEDLLAEYEAALALDDDGPANLPPGTQILGWDLRAMFEGLNDSNLGSMPPFLLPYPLVPLETSMTTTTNLSAEFELNAFTGRYFRFTAGGATVPEIAVEVTGADGVELPVGAGVQVTVVRLQ